MVSVFCKRIACIVLFWGFFGVEAVRRRALSRSNAQVGVRASSSAQMQAKSQFVDTLLMGILQMLLNMQSGGLGAAGAAPSNMAPGMGQVPQLPTAQYEVPEPVITEEEEEPVPPETIPAEQQQQQLQTAAQQFSNLSPETLIAKALNAQQNQMGALNKQIASLANEVTEWKDLKAKALEAGQQAAAGAENQIQLTIRYPGTAANETQAAQEEQKEKTEEQERASLIDFAGGANSAVKIDPSTLRVPVFIIAPKAVSDYSEASAKAVRETAASGKDAATTKQLQLKLLQSPLEREKIERQKIKHSLAHAAFFANDKKITEQRILLSSW